MVDNKRRFYVSSFVLNLTTTVLLLALLGLGAYVNISKFIIGAESTNGYRAIALNTTSWNVACTVVGTAVGLLAVIAYANQDECITRRELASNGGVVAMFLRPLSLKRGAEQIFHLQFPLERTLLVVLTAATALMSAATVALFGIHTYQEVIVNPSASYPLAGLNSTFFEVNKDGSLFPVGSPGFMSVTSQLSGFLYKAAYISGLKIRGLYSPQEIDIDYVPEQGSLGDTIYGSLNTGGIGLNLSSYLENPGLSDGFDMPARYQFDRLEAFVFGTNVSVSCRNATSDYSVSSDVLDSVRILFVAKPNALNLTLVDISEVKNSLTSLAIGSAVTVNRTTEEPFHTVIVADFLSEAAYVLECTYNGQEYLANISVASAVSPLQIDSVTVPGPLLGPTVKQKIANITHSLLSSGGQGGNLALGFIDAKYNTDGDNSTDVAPALESILGQLGETYISLLRQKIERSNAEEAGSSDPDSSGSELTLYVTLSRLGGAQFGWLAVPGLLLIGSVLGTARSCMRAKKDVEYDSQNVVKLLSAIHDARIQDTSRLRCDNELVIVGQGMGVDEQIGHK